MLRRTAIAFILIFAVWHFEWICSLFFMSLARPGLYAQLMGGSVMVWVLALLPGLAAFWMYLRTPLRQMKLLQAGEGAKLSDGELKKSLDRILFLPLWSGIVYSIAWWSAGCLALVFWYHSEVGALATGSLLIGQFAGGLACPFMMIGVMGALSGSMTERFTVEALRRNFPFQASRLGMSARLILAFMFFAVGFTIWLGGFGFFSSYHSVVRGTQRGVLERHATWIASNIDAQGAAQWTAKLPALSGARTANSAQRSAGELSWITPAGQGFLPKPRTASAGDADFSIPVELSSEIRERLTREEQSTFYDSRTESVVAWSPLPRGAFVDSDVDAAGRASSAPLYLVSIAKIDFALTGLSIYLIWLGVFTGAGGGGGAPHAPANTPNQRHRKSATHP
ncbi:MAG: hypothetical protein RIF32_01405, partial [Leptospirales bacterium]